MSSRTNSGKLRMDREPTSTKFTGSLSLLLINLQTHYNLCNGQRAFVLRSKVSIER